MSAGYWALWLLLTVTNAALLYAHWRFAASTITRLDEFLAESRDATPPH